MTSTVRFSRLIAAVVLASFFFGCAAPGPDLPGRVDFPGDETESDTPVVAAPSDTPADEALTDLVDADLFSPVRSALDQSDWVAAHLALPRRQDDESATAPPGNEQDAMTVAMDLWIRYYDARIALLRGNLAMHDPMLDELTRQALPPSLDLEVRQHLTELARRRGDNAMLVTRLADLLQRAPESEPQGGALRSELWMAVQGLDEAQMADLRGRGNREVNGWLDLANAAAQNDARTSASTTDQWLSRHADHPAYPIAERTAGRRRS